MTGYESTGYLYDETLLLAWQVFAGAKPLLDKTLGILVEGLIDTFLSLAHENQDKELRTLDTNGLCQLMLEALAQQYTSELLQAELERTRINTAFFIDVWIGATDLFFGALHKLKAH